MNSKVKYQFVMQLRVGDAETFLFFFKVHFNVLQKFLVIFKMFSRQFAAMFFFHIKINTNIYVYLDVISTKCISVKFSFT